MEFRISDSFVLSPTQLLTWLRLSGCRVGFLMNFNVKMIKFGIMRIVL
jgi:hypothetical protein